MTLAFFLLTMVSCGGGGGSSSSGAASPPPADGGTTPPPAGGGTPPPSPPGSPNVVSITTTLSGAEEVPPVSTAATGTGTFNIDLVTGALTGSVAFSNLAGNSTVAHIHQGAAGTIGPIVVSLIVSFEGGVGGPSGTFFVPPNTVLSAAQIDLLRAGLLYWNVHSSMNPNGEIRGQILFP